jgi:hypothetical protein
MPYSENDASQGLGYSRHMKLSTLPPTSTVDPQGRPHIICRKCGASVVLPEGASKQQLMDFAEAARNSDLDPLREAASRFQLGPVEAKLLFLHVTRIANVCNRCSEPVLPGNSVCLKCASVNLNW